MSNQKPPDDSKKITIRLDGPYVVHGSIPLVRKRQIVSEQVEPLTWEKMEDLQAGETYELCRCGQSKEKPFCDGTHHDVDFDGTETADTGKTADRQQIYPGSTGITIKRDYSLCAESGFCGTRKANIKKMALATDNIDVRSQIIAMIERCPSGSFTYSMDADGADIEPDLPAQIAATTEMTSDGPIDGPLWVTGQIPIERADGQPMETRNRVTLCCCGKSKNKPLCDGTHRFQT